MEEKSTILKDELSRYLRKCGLNNGEIERYCRDLARMKNPYAWVDLYDISTFYFYLKQANRLIQDKILRDALKFIAIFSLIEKLCSEQKFVELKEWMQSNEIIQEYEPKRSELPLKELFKSLIEGYHRYHGSTQKILQFFRILEKEEKIAVIRYIRKVFSKRYGIPLIPICHRSGCKFDELCQSCNFDSDRGKCPIWGSEEKLNDCLERIAKDIYEIRNKFVHDAIIPLFPEKEIPLFHVLDRKKPPVQITFQVEYFESLIDKYFRQLLDIYVKNLDK